MTTSRRGTIEIDRSFGKLGALRVASGTKDRALKAQLDGMLTTLNERRQDVLKAILDRRLSVLEVWNAYSAGDLGSLPLTPIALLPLKPTMEAWKARLKNKRGDAASEKHRVSIQITINHLARHGETVGDLAEALLSLREELLPERKRTYQLARAHALGFARDLKGAGRHSKLYADVANVPDVMVVTNTMKGVPVAIFRERVEKLEPVARAHAWALVLSGMRVNSEYLVGRYRVLADRVEIRGSKLGPVRNVPMIAPIAPPTLTYKRVRSVLAKVSLQPHMLRRCFGRWLEECGIPVTRVKLYMGHSVRSQGAGVTGTYLDHDVLPELPADTEKFRAFVGPVDVNLRLEKQA